MAGVIAKKLSGVGAAVIGLMLVSAPPVAAQKEVTLYTSRDPALTMPVLERFSRQTGIAVNVVPFKTADEIEERLAKEGTSSRADMAMIPDIGGLFDLIRAGRTQPVSSSVIESVVPASLRHPTGQWVALSYRIRAIIVAKDRAKELPASYADLADPRYSGKICIRSGSHPYNAALFGAMMTKSGDEPTAFYLQSLKGNLAHAPGGGDRDVARDVARGVCDVGIINTYYVGLMLSGAGGPEQKRWAEALQVVLPVMQEGGGAHMNVTGVSIMRNAPNRAGAVALLEFLVTEEAQKTFADINFEYPVRTDVPAHPLLAGFGDPKLDTTSLSVIANSRPRATAMVAAMQFDQFTK